MTESTEPPLADWLAQFGPRDMRPRRSETIILTFDFAKEDEGHDVG